MATKVYDVVAVVGTYMKDGVEKKRYKNCGAVFQNENGYFMKLDSLPVGNEWNGFLSLFEPKNQQQGAPQQGQQSQGSGAAQSQQEGGAGGDFDDDIPF